MPHLRPLLGTVFGGLLLASAPAQAGWPDDVTLSQLATWNGQPVEDLNANAAAYERVVKELAFTLANKPLAPAETLGLAGFSVSLVSTVGFIETARDSAEDPSSWERVHVEDNPSDVLWVPTFSLSKGLPLSLEAGAKLGYVAFSRQTAFGAWGRWALIEGYSPIPDLSVQVGYTGYVGNEELELGVVDLSARLGTTLAFGHITGVHTAAFSPYLGLGTIRIQASPRLSNSDQAALGISTLSATSTSEFYAPGFAPLVVHGGFRLLSGDVQFIAALEVLPSLLPSLSVGLGYVY